MDRLLIYLQALTNDVCHKTSKLQEREKVGPRTNAGTTTASPILFPEHAFIQIIGRPTRPLEPTLNPNSENPVKS